MTVTHYSGNIFTSKAQTIVNTVNCVGVMGAGIALEFKLRYPDMFTKYQLFCQQQQLSVGKLWLYKPTTPKGSKQILNFPTKHDWKQPTKERYLEQGLDNFVKTYKQRQISSIAFPILGAGRGGLSDDVALTIMEKYFAQCSDINIEIWHYDPCADDDLYLQFKTCLQQNDEAQLKQQTKLRIDYVRKVLVAIQRDDINSLSALSQVKGIGLTTIEKLFIYCLNYKEQHQTSLF